MNPRTTDMVPVEGLGSDLGVLGSASERALETLNSWWSGFEAMLPNLAVAVVVTVLGVLLARRVRRTAQGAFEKRMDRKVTAFWMARAMGVAVLGATVVLVLNVLHLDKAVTSLLAGLGVAGLALGFALKEIAANAISGLLLAGRAPFRVGDCVEIAGREGIARAIELSYTKITTYDGLTVIVPNKDVLMNPIVNLTQTKERRIDLGLGVSYADDLGEVSRVLKETLSELSFRDPDREPEVIFTEFGDSSINLTLRLWLTDAHTSQYVQSRSKTVMAVKAACDEAGISIPFPIRTIDFGANEVGGQSMMPEALTKLAS